MPLSNNNTAELEAQLNPVRSTRTTPSPLELQRGWLDTREGFSTLRSPLGRKGVWVFCNERYNLVEEADLAALGIEVDYRQVQDLDGFDPARHVVVLFDPHGSVRLSGGKIGYVCQRPNACTAFLELPCTQAEFTAWLGKK